MSDANIFDIRFGEIVRELSQIRNLELLNKIGEMIEESRRNQVVGYEADGTPITHSMLLKSIEEAEKDYKEGRTYSTSEIIQHFENQEEDA